MPETCGYRFGISEYAAHRTGPDEQDAETLEQLIQWTEEGSPCCHIRIADGELKSILNFEGKNTDGHEFRRGNLGSELRTMLEDMAGFCDTCVGFGSDGPKFLLGGCYDNPPDARLYLEKHDLLVRMPWVPCQIFVNGILSGRTLQWLRALRNRPGKRIVVCNSIVSDVAKSLDAAWVPIPTKNAYDESVRIERDIEREIEPGCMVIYAAGMPGKPIGWKVWRRHQDTSAFDVGHLWDGAFGIKSRSWLLPDEQCERLAAYNATIAPRLRGETAWT